MKTMTVQKANSTFTEKAVKVISFVLTSAMTIGLILYALKAVNILQANNLLPR